MPLIQSEVVVVVDRDQPGSLTLRYTPTPIQSSRFNLYRFRISDKHNTTKERIVDDTDTKVTFVGLTPGKLYNVTVWTVSDNVESRPLLRQDRLCEYPCSAARIITMLLSLMLIARFLLIHERASNFCLNFSKIFSVYYFCI